MRLWSKGTKDWKLKALNSKPRGPQDPDPWPQPASAFWLNCRQFLDGHVMSIESVYSNPVTNWRRISGESGIFGAVMHTEPDSKSWIRTLEPMEHGQFNKPIYLWKPKCISIVGHRKMWPKFNWNSQISHFQEQSRVSRAPTWVNNNGIKLSKLPNCRENYCVVRSKWPGMA